MAAVKPRPQRQERPTRPRLRPPKPDATKRALATFGNPFGLALYDRERVGVRKRRGGKAAPPIGPFVLRSAAGPDEASFDRPSECLKQDSLPTSGIAPQLPCLICGRSPSHARHFAQSRGVAHKSAMNSPYRYAPFTINRTTLPAMRDSGGRNTRLIRSQWPRTCGAKAAIASPWSNNPSTEATSRNLTDDFPMIAQL